MGNFEEADNNLENVLKMEAKNENWVDHTIYSFNKNGKHYQIIF